MLSLGDIQAAISLAKDVIAFIQNRPRDADSRKVIESLKTIYFDSETIGLIEKSINAELDDRRNLMRRLSRHLLDVRYEVHRSLITIEEEGFRDQLGLRAKRLFDDISRGKVDVRNSLILAINSSNPDMVALKCIMDDVKALNDKIETVDEQLRTAERKN